MSTATNRTRSGSNLNKYDLTKLKNSPGIGRKRGSPRISPGLAPMPKDSATRVRSKPLEWLGTKARHPSDQCSSDPGFIAGTSADQLRVPSDLSPHRACDSGNCDLWLVRGDDWTRERCIIARYCDAWRLSVCVWPRSQSRLVKLQSPPTSPPLNGSRSCIHAVICDTCDTAVSLLVAGGDLVAPISARRVPGHICLLAARCFCYLAPDQVTHTSRVSWQLICWLCLPQTAL